MLATRQMFPILVFRDHADRNDPVRSALAWALSYSVNDQAAMSVGHRCDVLSELALLGVAREAFVSASCQRQRALPFQVLVLYTAQHCKLAE